MCCYMRPDPLKEESEAYIGNILESSLDDIWFGQVAEEIRLETLEGRLHKKCSQSPGCPFVSMKSPYPKKEFVYNEYPIFLEIDLPNTHCNVGGLNPHPINSPACIMCERASPFFRPEKNRLMEVLERLKHVVPNLSQIHIQGIAEPFFQTREEGYLLFDVLDRLGFDNYSDKITLSVTTNATLFKKSVREAYLKRVPNSITNFSLDAATPETFKKIRIFDCFDKVIENIYSFASERNIAKQALRIHCNVNTMNVSEAHQIVAIGKHAFANFVEFNPTNGHRTDILVNRENCGLFAKAQLMIENESKRLGVPVTFMRPLDMGMTQELIQITF